MDPCIYLDFETRSPVNLLKTGAWKYALSRQTEIMCMALYAVIDEAEQYSQVFTAKDLKEGPPAFLLEYLKNGATLVAHNAHFEYAIWNLVLAPRYGWPQIWDPKRWDCTLARAAACNIPYSLDGAATALGLKYQKDLTGRATMLKLTKPVEIDPIGSPVYNEDPALYDILYKYCEKDVLVEMELGKRLPPLSPGERKVWELDLTINRRGVKADTKVARKAVEIAGAITDELNGKLQTMTGGAVDKASRIAAIKTYLKANGIVVGSLDKASVTNLLSDPTISQRMKDVIKIRQQVGKSSTAKYRAILDFAAEERDGRMRGMLQYHAAGTGRWGGRGPQPQNFPKGVKGLDADSVIQSINRLSPKGFHNLYGDEAMNALSTALRGALTAGPGKTLVAADYSAIEARVLFWMAGDALALNKYTMGVNLYVDMARFLYNDFEITKENNPQAYALGKAAILGCGYGMGAVKFLATCQAQGIDVTEEMAQAAVKAYRTKYKAVVDFWYAAESAARSAVRSPGSVYYCGPISTKDGQSSGRTAGGRCAWGMDKNREFLVCRLPSGRHLRYYRPRLRAIITPYGEKDEIHYQAAALNGGKLEEVKTYGGSLVENMVQGTARDIMANGMLNAEAAGFPVVLTVHDELVTEKPPQPKDVENLIKAMCTLPPWADGLPIAAEGWSGFRYRK